MDTFFVSVERVLDPRLLGRPVVIGADPRGRGVLCATSYEARKFGVHAAMPVAWARHRLPPETAWLRPTPEAYSAYSTAIHELLRQDLPAVHQTSIDEFDLDLSGCETLLGDLHDYGQRIQKTVRKEFGLPSTFGLSTNRLVSKIAVGTAKPYGSIEIPAGHEASFLAPLPVERLPGVGKTTRKRLLELGIHTVGDLAACSLQTLQTALGSNGILLNERARGIDRAPRPDAFSPRRRSSISRDVTLPRDSEDPTLLRTHLSQLVESGCQELRTLRCTARTITVRIRYSDFITRSRSSTRASTDIDLEIFDTSRTLLENLIDRRVRIRLIGIRLSNLQSRDEGLLDFQDSWSCWKRVLHATDRITQRHGPRTVRFGRSLIGESRPDPCDLFSPPKRSPQ